jgi:restriction endonuclease S subunit
MNLSSVTTTLLNMLILTGIPFSGNTIRGSNSFTDAITMGAGAPFPGLMVDYCFMNPPYGGDKSKGKEYKFAYSKIVKGDDGKSKKFFVNQEIQSIGIEDDLKVSAGIQLAMATLSADGGVCCIVLPQGFFFGVTQKIIELRKKIAEDYKIWYVVDVPSGSFKNTTTKTTMLVFQKGVGATETVSFIGLDEKILVEATREDLREKNYSLNFKQYLPQSAVEIDGFEMVKLGDIIEKKSSGKTKVGDISNTGEYPFFSCKINNPCGTHSSYDHEETEYLLFAKSGGNSKQPTGNNLGIGRFYYMTKKSASTSDVSKFVLKNQSTNLKYVSIVLHTKLYQIQSLAKYTTGLGHIDVDQMFDEIQIPLPSLEKQQEIVEQIDFYTQLAHTEKQSLKLLEKVVMGWIKEMGHGKKRVKLGELCSVKTGKYITKATSTPGIYPTYGGGDAGAHISEYNRENEFMISKDGVSEKCVRYVSGKFFLNHHGWTIDPKCSATYPYIGYWLLSNQDKLYELAIGTSQKGINQDSFYSIEIPLPTLAEQHTLQSDFDEIRHKHAKIAEYKAKAQEAIQRLIPGANAEADIKAETPVIQDTISLSHTSICEVEEDGSGCTCRLPVPIEKEEVVAVTSATATVKRRKPKVAQKVVVE